MTWPPRAFYKRRLGDSQAELFAWTMETHMEGLIVY